MMEFELGGDGNVSSDETTGIQAKVVTGKAKGARN
jgi:hypothetical protein